jgi:adenylate cyclase
MKVKSNRRVNITDQMVLIGFGLAALFWILESLLNIFFSYDVNFLQQFIGSGTSEIWTRLIILCLFAIFGSHAQYTINARNQLAKKMEKDAATRERFQRLLSPDLAEMVVSGQLKVEKGGESRVATVLFADIRNFTAMSENTRATEVLQMLNEYYETIVEIVFRHEGTVDKFIGDAMMVIWGAPVAHDDDPSRAVRAAIDMQERLVEFNKIRSSRGKRQIQIGIGINTGNLVAGYIGSSRTMSYSVIGDTVNTASRLCKAANAGQILISEQTYAEVIGDFKTLELEPIMAKGKGEPVNVYNVIGNHHESVVDFSASANHRLLKSRL